MIRHSLVTQVNYYADEASEPDEVSCEFDAVKGGDEHACHIVNDADPVPVEITKDWIIEGMGGDEVDQHFELTLYCDAEIVGGYSDKNYGGCGGYPGLTAGGGTKIAQSEWCLELHGSGDTTFTPEVIPEWPGSHCWVTRPSMTMRSKWITDVAT